MRKKKMIFSECWLGANMVIPADKDIRAEVLASLKIKAYRASDVKEYTGEKTKLFAFIVAINAYNSMLSPTRLS